MLLIGGLVVSASSNKAYDIFGPVISSALQAYQAKQIDPTDPETPTA